jgi:hypothetical protein
MKTSVNYYPFVYFHRITEHCALRAWPLMTNHDHLLVTADRAKAIPRLDITQGQRYMHYISTNYCPTGIEIMPPRSYHLLSSGQD